QKIILTAVRLHEYDALRNETSHFAGPYYLSAFLTRPVQHTMRSLKERVEESGRCISLRGRPTPTTCRQSTYFRRNSMRQVCQLQDGPTSRRDRAIQRAMHRSMHIFSLRLILNLALVIAINLAVTSIYAQESSTSGIVGHVTDVSGAVVPGATIHVVNAATSAERTAITNGSGEFSIPNLPPANY